MTYQFLIDKTKATPQTEAIPGREAEMIQGDSAAIAFDVRIWTLVKRCLLLGTAIDQYYIGKDANTKRFIEALEQIIAENPRRVADEIVYASDGHGINNHTPILALTFLSMGDSKEAKQAFKDIFFKVIRTGSHFHEWVAYTKSLRGMGKIVKEMGIRWLKKDVKWLTYQMLKYPQRMGFSFRDELRLFKPKSLEGHVRNNLYGYISGKKNSAELWKNSDLAQVYWYEWLKRHPDQGVKAIQEGKLTHEMVAPIANMNQSVWQELFSSMPVTAMLRNLGSLTEIGVIAVDRILNINRIEEVFTNSDVLKKARIHPIDILKALKTYQSGGRIGRSQKTWTPVPRVTDILEKALELSFDTIEPTNKVFLHALDISSSMDWKMSIVKSVGVTPAEITAVMALATAKTEPNYIIRGFSTEFIELGITASDSFTDACRKVKENTFGSTDASVAYDWAIANNVKVDVFCFWTDSESWAGRRHPSQALAEYRKKINPNAKAVYTSISTNQITLADPKDPYSYDFAGFDPSVPRAIQVIATEL